MGLSRHDGVATISTSTTEQAGEWMGQMMKPVLKASDRPTPDCRRCKYSFLESVGKYTGNVRRWICKRSGMWITDMRNGVKQARWCSYYEDTGK